MLSMLKSMTNTNPNFRSFKNVHALEKAISLERMITNANHRMWRLYRVLINEIK